MAKIICSVGPLNDLRIDVEFFMFCIIIVYMVGCIERLKLIVVWAMTKYRRSVSVVLN